MFLTGDEILHKINERKIGISPFDETNLGPAWYDLSIGHYMGVVPDKLYDPDVPVTITTKRIPEDILVLGKGQAFAAHSFETVDMRMYLGFVETTQEFSACGLQVKAHMGVVYPGYSGQILLYLYATRKIIIRPRAKVARLLVSTTMGQFTGRVAGYNNLTEEFVPKKGPHQC